MSLILAPFFSDSPVLVDNYLPLLKVLLDNVFKPLPLSIQPDESTSPAHASSTKYHYLRLLKPLGKETCNGDNFPRKASEHNDTFSQMALGIPTPTKIDQNGCTYPKMVLVLTHRQIKWKPK